jgi:hypothetical protein
MTQYIFCLPGGGFNDVIEQIMLCLQYAIRHNRILVLDTHRVFSFKDDITNYFDISHSHIYQEPAHTFYAQVKQNRLECYPSVITYENIDIACGHYSGELNAYQYKSVLTRLDLSRAYEEPVVFHSNCGGGTGPVNFFNLFPLKPIVLDELTRRWRSLTHPYIALHIRHTDYKSNISDFITTHSAQIAEMPCVFLASDNKSVIDTVVSLYGSKIHTFSTITGKEDTPMHYRIPIPPTAYIVDMICDFLLLVVADEYRFSCTRSNYSKNAERLRATPFRERLLAQLTETD